MKRTFRSWISLLLLVLLMSSLVCGTACAATIPKHTSNFYVNDFAGVFTDEQIKVMMDKAIALCEEHDGAQVVITTVPSLDGETVENYANQMYNEYKIGKDSMGVLVLMSVNDRKIRVEVGRNMQVYIPDSKAAKLMNTYAIPKLKQDKFAEGLMDLQDALIVQIEATLSIEAVESEEGNSDTAFAVVIGVFVLAFLFVIVIPVIIEYQEEKERQKQRQRMLNRMQLYKNNRYRYGNYPVSRRYSGSYPTSKKYSSGSYTSYNSNYYDSSSSSSSNSSNDDSTIFSDDSSSFSGFDGCSDGGGASGDF